MRAILFLSSATSIMLMNSSIASLGMLSILKVVSHFYTCSVEATSFCTSGDLTKVDTNSRIFSILAIEVKP